MLQGHTLPSSMFVIPIFGMCVCPYIRAQDTLRYVDTFAKDLHTGLVDRNLTNIVDIVFVSDHGMTDTSHPEFIYMDDILGEQGWASIEHEDGM